MEYDATSSFYDSTSQLFTEIMIKDGDATNPFKFIYYDSNSNKLSIDCRDSEGYTFVKLINNFLFLKDAEATPGLWVCKFDPAVTSNLAANLGLVSIPLPSTS